MNFRNAQKLRHGSASVAITAAVIALVLLLNIGFTALCTGHLLFFDISAEKIYTVSDAATDYLKLTFDEVNAKRQEKNEEDVKVDIIFCADPDMLKANEYMRYVYYTALELQKKFPDTINVEAVNVWANPSAVDAYRTTSYSAIYQSNIIIASGSEFRTTKIDTYYVTDENSSRIWAYNGEKKFVQSIIAVTKAEAPICGITTNHGEPFATEEGKAEYSEFLKVIEAAGYEIQFLNLETDEIPKDCRLILTFDPQTDFVSSFQTGSTVSEISKMSKFLEKTYSFMLFVDADTPVLRNLEELMEEWGISFDRHRDAANPNTVLGNYQIVSESALDSKGLSIIGAYEKEALGGSVTANMRKYGGDPKVIFSNAMSISYSHSYEDTFVLPDAEKGTNGFTYGSYYRNNHSRAIFDMFRSGEKSFAQAVKDGNILLDENGTPLKVDTHGDYKLMTLTRESRTVGEGKGYTSINDSSYVCAVGSTDFASNKILKEHSYGNTDVLLETLRIMGKEVVPVGLAFKPMYEFKMKQASSQTGDKYYTEAGNTAWTVVLVLLPAVAFAVSGTVILIKRKFRH